MVFDLASRGRALGVTDDTEEIEEQAFAYALHEIRDGKSVKSLGEQVGVSRPLVRDWLMSTDERKRMVVLARESSGESHAEDGLAILDECDDPRLAGLASSRANYRKWLASVRDRSTFGTQVVQQVGPISFGDIHLQVMRQAQLPAPSPARHDEVVILDPEIVSS